MTLSWKPLSISRSAEARLPSLLISHAFNTDSYKIHVTDLTRIWGESLDRPSIIKRSQNEGTSIDASDASQFHILLDKIKLGLEGGKGTRSTLTIDTGAGRPEITIKVIIELPGGLSPLEWPVRLAAEQESFMTSQLTIPLLEAQHVHMQEMSSLAEVLKDKDHVIQKVLDKIEEQGTQLGQIFPQAVGRGGRKVDRTEAALKVKGLGRFDIDAWRKNLDNQQPRDVNDLLKKVFGNERPEDYGFQAPIKTSLGATTWWESVRGESIKLSAENSENITAPASDKVNQAVFKQEDSSKDDDDFQVQASQPHPDPPKARESKRIDDESTDNDDDLGAVSQRSRIADSFPPSPPAVALPKLKKLDVIGGRKPIAEAPSPIEVDTTDDASSLARQPSPDINLPSALVHKKKGGLGRIGGKKEPQPPPKEPTPPPPSPPADTAKPQKGRLGKIGGKKKDSVDLPLDGKSSRRAITSQEVGPSKESSAPSLREQGAESRGRPIKVGEEATPPPRETSEERADRKREQLKRELEAKSKAPVKKKRKF